MVDRFDVYLVNLDAEISKNPKNTRPCVVVSPDELNHNITTVLIAPLSGSTLRYPTRVEVDFLNSRRLIVLDQLRAVDKNRLVKKIAEIEPDHRPHILNRLTELFAE